MLPATCSVNRSYCRDVYLSGSFYGDAKVADDYGLTTTKIMNKYHGNDKQTTIITTYS